MVKTTLLLACLCFVLACGTEEIELHQDSNSSPQVGHQFNGTETWQAAAKKCGNSPLELTPDEGYRLDANHLIVISKVSETEQNICKIAHIYTRLIVSANSSRNDNVWTIAEHGLLLASGTKKSCFKKTNGGVSRESYKDELGDLEKRDISYSIDASNDKLIVDLTNMVECQSNKLHLELKRKG